MCITLNLCGYCPGTPCKFLLWALPLLCMSALPSSPQVHLDAVGWGAGTQGGEQACMDTTQAKAMGCIHVPDKPFSLVITTSHLPERVWSPLRLFIYLFFWSTPSQKKELPVLKLSLLEKVSLHGGMSWGIWAADSMITAPETRTQALFPRGTRRVTEHHRVHFPGLWSLLWAGPGQSQSVSASFLCLQFLGYKHQFQGISSQQQVEWMNKYLVTSLIMWIATELLRKTTETLCRYFSYKLM